MTTTAHRLRRAAMLAGTSLLLSAGLFAAPASAAVPPPLCDGLAIDFIVPAGGALFQDPAGNAGSVIQGTIGADDIEGLGGNDHICGLEGDDTINGGPGNDTLKGGPNIDTIEGDTGNDTIHGGSYGDFLYGQGGANSVSCGDGNDFADGGVDPGAEDDVLLTATCEFNVNF